jgi:hypothetical protein
MVMVFKTGNRNVKFLEFQSWDFIAGCVDILMQCVKIARYMSGVLISLGGNLPNSASVCVLCFRNLEYSLTYLLMELSPSGGATNYAATQEFPSILWNPKVHHRVHKSLSWARSIQSLPSHLISFELN